MPSMDITNPAVIIFLVECYEKESRLRLNWINKHRNEILKAASIDREPTNYYESDVTAHYMLEGMPTISRDHVVAGYNRKKKPIRDAVFIPTSKDQRKGHSIVDVGLGDPKEDPRLALPEGSLQRAPVMRPMDPKLRRIIYKPKPEFGREVYLDKRLKIWPEKRYYFPESMNWDYGWRMHDSKLRQKPEYGRCWRLMRTLRTRVGPQPDPPHYQSPDPAGPNKCPI